jgi:hypothetical protein
MDDQQHDVTGEALAAELAENADTEARLDARKRGETPPADAYVHTEADVAKSCKFAQKVKPPYPALSMNVRTGRVRAISWHETRRWMPRSQPVSMPRRAATTSRARPRARRASARAGASRDGPSEPSDEPPHVGLLRGFLAASVRMVHHLERRRAKAAVGMTRGAEA